MPAPTTDARHFLLSIAELNQNRLPSTLFATLPFRSLSKHVQRAIPSHHRRMESSSSNLLRRRSFEEVDVMQLRWRRGCGGGYAELGEAVVPVGEDGVGGRGEEEEEMRGAGDEGVDRG